MTIIIPGDFSRPVRRALGSVLKRRKLLLTLTKFLQSNKTLTASLLTKQISQSASKSISEKAALASDADRTVRVCQLSEYKAVAFSLARAFYDDPCALFFADAPDMKSWTPDQKWDLHLEIMEYMVYAHMMDGMVTTVGEDYGAVALWMPPGKDMDSHYTTFRSGLWRLNYRLSRVGRNRWYNDFMPLLHDTKHDVLGDRDNNSWYLVYLGTRPGARRKGLARALIEDVNEKADAAGLPVYLESSKAMNVPIYEKFGFEEKTRVFIGGEGNEGSVPLDIMVREPQSKSN